MEERAKCEHTTRKGTPCGAPPLTGTNACAAHSGRLNGDPHVAARVRVAKALERRQRAETIVEVARMGLDARLAMLAGEREEELARALLDLALKDKDRQAILAVYDRLEGRATQRVVTEAAETGSDMGQLDTAELRRMLRVIPGGNPTPRMDTGIEATQ